MRDYETFRYAGKPFAFKIERDDSMGPPWEEHDGHGDVSEWTSRGKAPGELVLSEDRGSFRYYDFAGACKIARRDGWGFLPGPLQLLRVDGKWQAWVNSPRSRRYARGKWRFDKLFFAMDRDVNRAIGAVYAAHRATMSARAYAAGAAMSDFERLRGWCAGQWEWVGVVVARVNEDGADFDGETQSVWGIESDSPDYHAETARELAAEFGESE